MCNINKVFKKMSNEEEKEYSIFQFISNQNKNILYEIIYKPNENINWKKKELNELKKYNYFYLGTDKEYSGNEFRIFGKKFVEKNKKACKIIYNNKQYGLKEFFNEIDISYKDKNIIKLKLIAFVDIIDMSEMFYGCYHLLSVSEYSKKNSYKQIEDSKNIGSEPNYNPSLPEEDNYNTFYQNYSSQLPFDLYSKINDYNYVKKNSKSDVCFPKSPLEKKI